VEAERKTGEAFAATWRNSENEIVGTTFGGTMCWMPLKPWSLRISRDDWSGIVPCGECPGCLEFYRRRLADRLKSKYSRQGGPREKDVGMATQRLGPRASWRGGPLYLVRIYAPIEHHAALSRKLHRRRGIELEPGFIRLGATSFAVLAHQKVLPPLYLAGVRLETRTEAIRLSRGRRAWRSATAGMLVAREAYGPDLNRFYMPGLPPAEKESWEVQTRSGANGYNRALSPRVWKRGNLVLVPPSVWALGRADRRTLRRDLGRQSSPEGIARVMAMVSEVLARRSQSSLLGPAARPVLNTDQVREFYSAMAKRVAQRASAAPSNSSSSLPSEGRGYVSSIHSGGIDPPEPVPIDGLIRGIAALVTRHLAQLPEDHLVDLTHKQYVKRRERRALDEHLEKLLQRVKGRT
jgi:hypothetical protein